jgi:hypothetical protein
MPQQPELRCSFCDKSQNDVRKLIAGPAVYICDECVQACADIIADDALAAGGDSGQDAETDQSSDGSQLLGRACTLCGFPMLMEDALPVEELGFLCRGCVGAVEAAIGKRKLPG